MPVPGNTGFLRPARADSLGPWLLSVLVLAAVVLLEVALLRDDIVAERTGLSV